MGGNAGLSGDCLCATHLGWRPIETITPGDFVSTVLGMMKPVQRVEHSRRPVFRVTFGDGAELCVDAEHQFYRRPKEQPTSFTPESHTYYPVCLKDLQAGDEVRVAGGLMSHNVTYNVPDHLTNKEYGFLAGLMLSRSAFIVPDRTNPFFLVSIGSHPDDEWVQYLTKRMLDAGAFYVETVLGADVMQVSGRPLKQREKYLCASGKVAKLVSHFSEKRVLLEDQDSNAGFLAGLLDALFSVDGDVTSAERAFSLRLRVKTVEMGQDIRRILLMFGLHANVLKPFRRPDLMGYEVRMVGVNAGEFYRQIGLSHPAKSMELRHIMLNCYLAPEHWITAITRIEPAGEAEVYNLYEPEINMWVTDGIVSRGCGES